MTQLNFKYQNLKIDYLALNVERLVDPEQIRHIMDQFAESFDFNIRVKTTLDNSFSNYHFETRNHYQMSVITRFYSTDFWDGTIFSFSGKNAQHFYKLYKNDELDFDIFEPFSVKLGRFDICYSQHTEQREQLELFLKECQDKVYTESKKILTKFQRNKNGFILTIGSRKSPNFYRIYQTQDELRFELEMKKHLLDRFQNLFLNRWIEEFEHSVSTHFLSHSKKILVHHDNYTSWLRKTNKPLDSLVVTYLSDKAGQVLNGSNLSETKRFFKFLQFMSFARNLNSYRKTLCQQNYQVVTFKIIDFMDYTQVNQNQYQRNQFQDFFFDLQQSTPFVSQFSDLVYQSSATFPFVRVEKENEIYGAWIVQVAIVEELYFYSYPFSFPLYFRNYTDVYDLQVKLQIIGSYTQSSFKKELHVEDFLKKFEGLKNQKQKCIKQSILNSLHELKKVEHIQASVEVHFKNGAIQELEIDTLTTLQIGKANRIFYYEA